MNVRIKNSLRPFAAATVLIVVAALHATHAPAEGTREDAHVEVAADQSTTVVGSFESLSGLLAELCKQAGAELRAYDAPDREVTANLEGRPLSEAIDRLLAHENYLLGVRGGRERGSELRVAWVRVTGSKGTAETTVPAEPTASGESDEKSAGEETEATEATAASQQRVHEAVAAQLLADESRVAILLNSDAGALAQSLRQYPNVDQVLRKLRADQQHPAVVEKIDAILAELGEQQDLPAK